MRYLVLLMVACGGATELEPADIAAADLVRTIDQAGADLAGAADLAIENDLAQLDPDLAQQPDIAGCLDPGAPCSATPQRCPHADGTAGTCIPNVANAAKSCCIARGLPCNSTSAPCCAGLTCDVTMRCM